MLVSNNLVVNYCHKCTAVYIQMINKIKTEFYMPSNLGWGNSRYFKNLILKSVMVHAVIYSLIAMKSLITTVFKRHCLLATGIKSRR